MAKKSKVTTLELPSEAVVGTPSAIIQPTNSVMLEVEMVADEVRTHERLQKDELVERTYPLFSWEKQGATGEVNINGAKFVFKKGTTVKIPRSVAEVYDRRMLAEFQPVQNQFNHIGSI